MDEADSILKQIAGDKHNGRFEYRVLAAPELVADDEYKKIYNRLSTFHPTLAQGKPFDHEKSPGKRMVWLERHHPPKSTEAFECEYYSPFDVVRDPSIYNRYMNLLNDAWELSQQAEQAERNNWLAAS